MTPAARIQASIEILDDIAAGEPAEKALTRWARRSRYAGSGDRAAVRDHVYQVMRCWRSYTCLGGADSGRGRMVGALLAAHTEPDGLFTGVGHAPTQLSDAERQAFGTPAGDLERLDLPEWLFEKFRDSLGDDAETTAMALRERAPIMVRVNLRKSTVKAAVCALDCEGIEAEIHPIASTALKVTNGARKLAQSEAFKSGLVELQDGSSQAAMETVDVANAKTVLDFCAGGGGKSLALSARTTASMFAHDADAARMKDLPARADRAGVEIQTLTSDELNKNGPYDVVLCDVPCSGSGTWRRNPDAKWRFTPERLVELIGIQGQILQSAVPLTAPGGAIIYATCSVLKEENETQIARFVEDQDCKFTHWSQSWPVSDGGDGFFVTHLKREC